MLQACFKTYTDTLVQLVKRTLAQRQTDSVETSKITELEEYDGAMEGYHGEKAT